MPEPIGEEFIRIRPDASGFRAELEKQIAGVGTSTKGAVAQQAALSTSTRKVTGDLALLGTTNRSTAKASSQLSKELASTERNVNRYSRGVIAANAASLGFGRALTFASGAFLAGAALGAAIRTATDEFKQATQVQAQTQAVIKATGGAANVTAGQVDALSQRLLKLSGVDDELIKQGANVLLTFKNLKDQVGAGNDVFTRATKAVLDISTVFGTDLRSSAIQLGKALQDPAKGLTALRRSGITFSADQQKLIKSLVATGQVLTAQKIILAGVETQVGGTAAAVGRTLPGRLNILRERAKNALGEYVKRMTESRQATELATQAGQALGGVWNTLQGIAKTLGPPLVSIVQGTLKLTQAVGGAGTVVAAIAAYKAVGIAIALATAAQGAYTRAVLVGNGAITAQNSLLIKQAVGARLSAASLAGQTVGKGAGAVTIGEIGARSTVAAAGIGGLRLAVSALGGPLGIAAIAAGGLAIAFLKMRSSADAATGSVKAARAALTDLSRAVTDAQKITDRLAVASENRSLARLTQQQAARSLAGAQGAAARSTADPGSVEQLGLAAQLEDAQKALAKADREVAASERQVRIATEQSRLTQVSLKDAIVATAADIRSKFLPQIQKLRAEQTLLAQLQAGTARNLPNTALGRLGTLRAIREFHTQVEDVRKSLTTLADSGDPVEAKVGGALLVILSLTKQIKAEQLDKVLAGVAAGQSVNKILAGLGILSATNQPEGKQFQTTPQDTATAQEALRGARAALKTARDHLKVVRETRTARIEDLAVAQEQVRAAREQVTAAKEAAVQARQGLRDAREAAADSRRALADTLRSAREQINAAVTDAKSNLDSLGQTIAGIFQQFAEKAGTSLGTGGALGKRFRELRAQIIGGQGGPQTQRAAQRIAFELQAKRPAPADFQRQFSDLTDARNRGQISLAQFTKQFNALVKTFDIGAIRRQLGSAAANTLLDAIAAARKQAGLSAGGPQRAGGGTAFTLVKPLQAVAQAGRDIASARRDVLRADRAIVDAQRTIQKSNLDVIDAERKLRTAESKERKAAVVANKANTAALRANTKVVAANNALRRVDPKAKGDGKAGKDAQQTTTAGASAP